MLPEPPLMLIPPISREVSVSISYPFANSDSALANRVSMNIAAIAAIAPLEVTAGICTGPH